jgi:hypothetical protein
MSLLVGSGISLLGLMLLVALIVSPPKDGGVGVLIALGIFIISMLTGGIWLTRSSYSYLFGSGQNAYTSNSNSEGEHNRTTVSSDSVSETSDSLNESGLSVRIEAPGGETFSPDEKMEYVFVVNFPSLKTTFSILEKHGERELATLTEKANLPDYDEDNRPLAPNYHGKWLSNGGWGKEADEVHRKYKPLIEELKMFRRIIEAEGIPVRKKVEQINQKEWPIIKESSEIDLEHGGLAKSYFVTKLSDTFHGVGASTATSLYENDFITPDKVQDADVEELKEIYGIGDKTANQLVSGEAISKRRDKRTREIAVNGEVHENPELEKFVYYPNHYGAFFAFANSKSETPKLCNCAKRSVEQYVKLRRRHEDRNYSDPLKEAPLESMYFPDAVAKQSLNHSNAPIEAIEFASEVCHRCNLVTPEKNYCADMYGGKFKQRYGWYIQQKYFYFGVFPLSYNYLPEACPEELLSKLQEAEELEEKIQSIHSPERLEASQEVQDLTSERKKLTREIDNFVENAVREEFGHDKIGKGWTNETMLFNIVQKLLPDSYEVIHHYRPDWLDGLELDIFVPDAALGIEYQGQQHYEPVEIWGGEGALARQQANDERTAELCEQNDVTLVEFKYTEPLTEEHVENKISRYIHEL